MELVGGQVVGWNSGIALGSGSVLGDGSGDITDPLLLEDWQRLLLHLVSVQQPTVVSDGCHGFSWNQTASGSFSVASVALLQGEYKDQAWPNDVSLTLKAIWKIDVPPKIHIFIWRKIIDRLPTKFQLQYRGILCSANSLCVFCEASLESSSHLFFNCDFAKRIWVWVHH